MEIKEAKEDSQSSFQTIATFRGGTDPHGAEERDVGSTAGCSELVLSPGSPFLEAFVDILKGKKPSHPFSPYSHPCPGAYVLLQIPQKDLVCPALPNAWLGRNIP